MKESFERQVTRGKIYQIIGLWYRENVNFQMCPERIVGPYLRRPPDPPAGQRLRHLVGAGRNGVPARNTASIVRVTTAATVLADRQVDTANTLSRPAAKRPIRSAP